MGADHQQDPNNTFDSLKASMSLNPAAIEAFRESEVLWWFLLRTLSQFPTLLLMICSPLQPPGMLFCKSERGSSTVHYSTVQCTVKYNHHNTLDFLEAFMVAPFSDMPMKETTLASSRYHYRILRVTKAEVCFIFFFHRPLVYINFMSYKKS